MNTSKMDKFQEKLQKVLVPIADKLSNQRLKQSTSLSCCT